MTLSAEIKGLAVGLVLFFVSNMRSKALSMFWSSQYNLAGHKIAVFTGEGKLKEWFWLQK